MLTKNELRYKFNPQKTIRIPGDVFQQIISSIKQYKNDFFIEALLRVMRIPREDIFSSEIEISLEKIKLLLRIVETKINSNFSKKIKKMIKELIQS